MKNVFRLVTLLALALAAVPTTVRAADTKLGIVDLQRALNEVEEGKVAKDRLKKDFEAKQKQLDGKQDELRKMKGELDKQAVVMSEDARREKAAEFEKKVAEVQGFYTDLQKQLAEQERKATGGIFEKMAALTREIANDEGFTIVLERTDAGVVFAPPSIDITDQLIRRYNQRFPVGAGAAPAAGAPAKKPDAAKPAASAAKPAAKK